MPEADEVSPGKTAFDGRWVLLPRDRDRPQQRRLGLRRAIEPRQDLAEVPPVVDVGRLELELRLQQREVAPVLARLIALVADVIEFELRPIGDPAAVRGRDRVNRLDHALMHHPAEPDARIVAPQAVFEVRRRVHERPQQNPQRRLPRPMQPPAETIAGDRTDPLVGIEVQDPFAARPIQAGVPRHREAARPRLLEHDRSVAARDRDRAIDRPGVDDHDLVSDPL